MLDEMDMDEDGNMANRPPLGLIHIVHNMQGTRIGVPNDWLEAPVGEIFRNPRKAPSSTGFRGRMVEVIE